MAGDRIDEALRAAVAALADTSPSPRLDAEVLLAARLGRDRSYLRAYGDRALDPATARGFDADIAQRARGRPVAHVTGCSEFWSIPIQIDPCVLIPRPDTERLVEIALAHAAPAARILELGTGSGAIALALARELPGATITATDRDAEPLAVARRNIEASGLAANIDLIRADWFAGLAGQTFDLVVTNPPYVGADEPELAEGDVRFEPRTALTAGSDGLSALEHIIAQAPAHLRTGGWLITEHGWHQGEAVRGSLIQTGYTDVTTYHDLAGHERVTAAQSAS